MSTLPSKDAVLEWIRDHPTAVNKREISRAFRIKGADRIELKRLLKELEAEGEITRGKRRMTEPGRLPPVTVLVAGGPDDSGDIFATPQAWDGEGPAPRVLFVAKKGDPAIGEGDRLLARITPVTGEAHRYEGRLIRRIGAGPGKVLGIYRVGERGGRIVPVEKKADKEWIVEPGDRNGAREGELVEAEPLGRGGRLGLGKARILTRLGDPSAARAVSLIAIHENGIPIDFPDEAIAEAEAAKPVTLGKREDLRDLPLVTIDPIDARDHDDAVCAIADDDAANPGGFVVWVAIADVAHYVRPGSALDREARRRGNSTYFPDRVVPMLPEALSADLCSLMEGVDRPCLALRMVLNARGEKIAHRFTRGLMRSPASLNYAQVQAAEDGDPDDVTAPLLEEVIRPLYAAYRAVALAREKRQPLDLDLPERRIELDAEGVVTSVAFRERMDAHRVIEEFMILANVCAAETLEEKRRALVYRVHEQPNPEKLEALRQQVESVGLTLAKGQVLQTRHLNALLRAAEGGESDELVNIAVLRAQTQAYYSPENFGHFGLNLAKYAHFTSPIRRYSDLIVHRALITAHGWAPKGKNFDGMTLEEEADLAQTAEHISFTERRSMLAERDTNDRYLAAYLSDRVGAEFEGRVSGVARFGFFVKLAETGADGLVPVSTIGREYFHFNQDHSTLVGADTGLTIAMGARATVRLAEAVPATGGLIFELLSIEGGKVARGGGGGRRGSPKRKLARGKVRRAKAANKEKRS
jgi:ribonuclease R